MSWYHRIATFLNDALPQVRATRRTNLALLTVAILERRALAISVLVRAWRVELPYSHHQRKKRLFRFLSNTGFDTVAVQTALLGPICQAARLRGVTPIMIDWSDLGRGATVYLPRSVSEVGGCPCSAGSPRQQSWTPPRTEWRSSLSVGCCATCPPTSGLCCWPTGASDGPA